MPDESNHPPPAPLISFEETGKGADQATVAFCQQCGRGLTASTVRAVGSGIYCEPCVQRTRTTRPENTPGTSTGGYAPVPLPAVDPVIAPPPGPGEPNPVLAGFLGLIPGVGAMYNGQYPKGVIHLVIFVVLTSLADNLNWVLWWFVWGWIFYQAFEAYHTAQAKRDGMPLPDPFGWNDLGDRMGFSRTSPPLSSPSAARPVPGGGKAEPPHPIVPGPNPGPAAPAPPFTTDVSEAGQPTDTAPFRAPTSWTTSTADTSYPPAPVISTAPEAVGASYGQQADTQYAPTYTGVPVPAAVPPAVPLSLAKRFPAGAVWLIVFGILFLVANLSPGWRLEAGWLVPMLLALVALWIGGRRVETAMQARREGFPLDLATVAEGLIGSAILLTLAILLALQNANVVPLRHSWPAVLIVWGALLLAGRAGPAATPASAGSITGPDQVNGGDLPR